MQFIKYPESLDKILSGFNKGLLHVKTMGILQRYLDTIKARKYKQSQAEEDIKISHRIQERQKNANEREYERYMEEERQKMIEQELKKFRAKKQNEIWHTNVVSGDKNMFNGKCMFANKSNGSMLKWR